MYVGNEPITVVVDSGAATSIITSSLLEQLGYKSSGPSKVVIVTANGTREKAAGRVDNLPVNVQNLYINSPVHIIKSKDNVLILGNDWLKRAKAILNYGEDTLTLNYVDQTITVPVAFSVEARERQYIATGIEEEEESESEDEFLESQIYFSDNAFSSDEEELEFNPWTDYHSPPPKAYSSDSESESEDEYDEELKIGNPAVSLAEVEVYNAESSKVELHLGPLQYEQQVTFNNLLKDYSDICAQSQTRIGRTDVIKHRIITGDALPVAQPAYRSGPKKLKFIREEVERMEQQRLIRKSKSPWASPVVVVGKKGGDMRLCVDYRKLNAITKGDMYPLPRIDDMLESFSGANWFTTLDLASGYWQIAMEERDIEKTAFITPYGLYEFLVMPFGLAYAPGTFQRLMNNILHDYIGRFVAVYLDDIIVYSKGSLENHIDHIRQVFETLRRAHLKIKLKKCYFCFPNIHFLGHVVGRDGINPDPEKIEKVRNFPVPANVSQLRSALGLFSYYRRFIKEFARIARPLYELLKKRRSSNGRRNSKVLLTFSSKD